MGTCAFPGGGGGGGGRGLLFSRGGMWFEFKSLLPGESNEPLNVIKQKTERLSQRLFIGRSNIEPNVQIHFPPVPSISPKKGLIS